MNALTFEKASSIGFRSGEYGGKNSMRISVMTQNSEYTGTPVTATLKSS